MPALSSIKTAASDVISTAAADFHDMAAASIRRASNGFLSSCSWIGLARKRPQHARWVRAPPVCRPPSSSRSPLASSSSKVSCAAPCPAPCLCALRPMPDAAVLPCSSCSFEFARLSGRPCRADRRADVAAPRGHDRRSDEGRAGRDSEVTVGVRADTIVQCSV